MNVVTRSAAVLMVTTAVGAGIALPASASTNSQSGLVNVNVQNTTVQVPIAVAANVCNVAVNVLAGQLANGAAPCSATGSPSATATRGGSGSNQQSGLVNLNLQNTTVQLPVGIAANVCNVAANVLAQNLLNGADKCTAVTTPVATA